ncbi:hypothetical protein OJ997_18750 [Solirubrobacter phytolaccae]|uniref:Major facilitator superfamily (MFS) profile domain-containing protein n=1 Tax=Solirubrobacter phytolaccae TaxID=1404360 RepID=A0A9X3NA53_9ACTN|nr:hypothetical protein [Solirubrobacter phytolaccae]MDA0182354.1 hypothetical protein [Solirubrobacter phytolaccae]
MTGRIAAGVAAGAIAVAGLFVAILGIFVGADAADPADPASTGEAVALGLGFGLVLGAAVAGVVGCGGYALNGRLPGWRWLLAVPVGLAIVIAVLAAAG